MDNSEQDQPVESEPARPSSVWADMVVSGAYDQEEPQPEPEPGATPEPGTEPGAEPGRQAPPEGTPSWPASGLPPLFGQRSTGEERPSVPQPEPGSGYGGYRPLGSLPPSGPPPGSLSPAEPAWHRADADRPEPEDEQHEPDGGLDEPGSHWDEQNAPWEEPGNHWAGAISGWEEPGLRWVEPGRWEGSANGQDEPASQDEPGGHRKPGGQDEPGPGAGPEPGNEAAFGPWETYETEEGYGWTGGYGVVPEQGWAQSYDDPAEPARDADGARRAGGMQAGPGGHADYGAHAGRGAQPGPGAQAGYGTVAPEPDAPPGHEEPPPEHRGTSPGRGEAEPERGEPPHWRAESADSLTADLLLPGHHAAPPSGWRRALYQITGGLVRAPQSATDRRRKDLVQRARTPVAGGHHRVAVLSLKGGVGKTTTTVGLGSTLASLRGDRVIAVDANPDRGTLSDKLRLETAATVRDLLNEEDQIRRYADVRAYTTQSPSGLEVLASDRDPTVSVAFSDQDYVDVARVLEHYYSVSITDCGTGLLHSAMAGVLGLADQIVLVSSPSVDGARSASATLDWLAAHNYGDLVRSAVVVLSAIRPRSRSAVDLARLEQHFAARCRAVVRIPYDAHLEEGAEVDLAQLSRATADAYLVLAAEVGDGFSWPRH